MSGPWEKYQTGPWTQYAEPAPTQAPPEEESGFLRQVADVPLSVGRGALTGVRLVADAFGAGSGVSETIKGAEGYLAGLMSAQAKNDEKEVARIMKDAEDKGMGEQVKAAFQAFATAPVDLISQGLGTAAPAVIGILGGKVLGAGALGARAIGMGVGAGMGAGTAKSAIYEATKEELLKAGLPEAQAEERAQLAQSYGGKNLDQILLSTGLGAFASGTGLESSVKNILFKAGAQDVAKKGALQTTKTLTGKAAMEAVPEVAQGSQEQLAQNIALQREGFDVPTMRGVAGAGALEGLAGAGLGAAGGAFEMGARGQARAEADRILKAEAEAKRVADEAAAEQVPVQPEPLAAEKEVELVSAEQPVEEQAEKPAFPTWDTLKPGEMVTLYRGEGIGVGGLGNEENGQWWTTDRAKAERYGDVTEVTLPAEIVGRFSAQGHNSNDEFVFGGKRPQELAAKPEAPADDNYAILKQEQQRLQQQPKSPETNRLLDRIEERLDAIVMRDIENRRTDKEKSATSVFAQEQLPEVESRDVVVGNRELEQLQAAERLPDEPLTGREVKSIEKMRTAPPPVPDAQARLEQAEMDRRKFMRSKDAKQGNLMKYLEGKLALDEVSDIAPKGKGFEKLANEKGTYISELVSDGMLDEFLPPDQRAGQANFDAQQAAETIKENLRNKVLQPFDTQTQIRQLDDSIAAAEREAKEPSTVQFDLSEVEPGEAATVERAAGDQAVVESTDQIRYKRATGKVGIGKQAVQDTVDTVKARWANAPEVVVAENMDDPAIPQEVRDHNKEAVAKGAKGSPQGFYYKGKAYVIADSIGSTNEAVEALMHEALGHFGLRGVFGPKMETVLRDVIKNRRAEVESKAEQYGLDPKNDKDMLEAAEEVLAVMAQTKPGLPFVKRAMVIIRDFLRDLGFNIKMSDADIIQKYILPARAFVESGVSNPSLGGMSSSLDKPFVNSLKRNSKAISDFLESQSRQSKSDRLVNIPSAVMAHVLDVVNNEQVFRSVVRSIPVDVVDFLAGKNLSPKNVLSNKSVLENMFSVDREPSVTFGVDKSIAAALMRSVAISAAKVSSLTGGANKDGVAGFARTSDAIFGAQDGLSNGVVDAKDVTRNPNFLKWFGDSKVVDESGNPLVVSHITKAKGINVFDPSYKTELSSMGFHFGSKDQAEFRGKQYDFKSKGEPEVGQYYLSIKNPLRVSHMASYAPDHLADQMMDMGVLDEDAYADIQSETGYDSVQTGEKLVGILKDNGYDGLVYENEKEGEGDSFVPFDPTQIKSATGNIGTYDPDNADIRYQREAEPEAGQPKPTRQNIFGDPVLGTWSIQVDPKMELQDGLIYKMLDKNIDVKRIVEAVKKTGKEIASQWNPYLQEELYHGRTANAALEFQDKEWLPLLKDMEAKGVTIGELEKYLLNRHAEDYNKLVAKRNPNRPEMQDGGSGVTTEEARKYLADLDADTKAKYDELAARVDGITKGTRQLLLDTGYENKEKIEAWEKAFPNYVPLMREEGDFDYNFGSFGTGRGFDVRRDFSRSAMGSKRNVVDIIGNVIAARNNAIALTEKNRVAQAVYGLALEAPNPDFWMAINPEAEKVPEDAIDELRAMGLDEEAAEYLMKEPKQRVLDPKRDQIVSRINTKLRENDFVLATRINGEKRYVFFNPKDPRSKRAATALKNLDAQDLGTTLGMIAKVTRWMASVNTQYNPIFGPYNFLRDMQSAALQLSTTELAGQQKEVAANVVPSLKVIYSSLRKRRKGEKAEGELADLWKEFQKEGGQTGFRDNFSRTQDRTEALLNEMSKITEGKAKAGARAVFDWLSDYNDSLENAVRLSAYKVAKEKFKKEGFSDSEVKQKAASLAKNLTVNFNRKGDVATQMGALYAFFNASMQGTARMIETLKGPTGKKIMAGGLLLGSMQAALLAAAGFDDEEPPEFIRSKNIVIPTGDGNYIAFPMPLGFHVIPGLSRILTEWTLSGFDDTARRVTDLTGLFLDAFNPIGNAGWSVQTVTPTILDPFVALGENKDWTGKPISKEDIFSLRPTPGYTRAREGANWLSKELSEFLNYASGGTKYQPGVVSPTPEQIEYLVGQVFGGVGREAIKLTTSIEKTATGEDLPPYKIPLYGRFVGETKSSAAESNKFYKNMEKLNRLDLEVKGRREDREPIGDFMRENPETRLLPLANKTYKDVQALRKRRAALLEKDAPRESIQAVENMITRKMQVLNDRVKAMKQ